MGRKEKQYLKHPECTNMRKKKSDFKAGSIMDQFVLSLHSCRCSVLYDAMIDEPFYDDIIKLIIPVKLLTTWVLWSEGQRDRPDF